MAGTCPSHGQRIDKQTKRRIVTIGSGDEGVNLRVAQHDVARLLRVRQSCKADFPCVAVLDVLVMLRRQFEGGASELQVD